MSDDSGSDDAGEDDKGFEHYSSDEATSDFVLKCVKALNDSYPQPVNIAHLAKEAGAGSVGNRVLGLLRSFGFVAGSNVQTVLTLSGLRSLRIAAQAEYRVSQLLSGQPANDPNKVLLAILRSGFYNRSRDPFEDL